uniref:Uncharacterized protein n=1 Tax=Anguilla anguilla TaxID=7936 RepID=A0A0E9UN77_ANGAN
MNCESTEIESLYIFKYPSNSIRNKQRSIRLLTE